MTKDNPVAAGRHPLEAYADSYAQMSRDGDGRVDCRSVEVDIRQNMIPVTIASPVQAGIDPLVAEIEAGLEGLPASAWRTETAWPADYAGYVVCGFFGETPHMPRLPQAQAFVVTDDDFDDDLIEAMARHVARCSPDNIAKLIAGYRSQAERIAALTAERDMWRHRAEQAAELLDLRREAAEAGEQKGCGE